MISLSPTIIAIADAISAFSARAPTPSAWRTAEWQQAPAEIVQRSFFSAGVESARFLDQAQAGITSALDLSLDQYGRLPDREKFIADMRGVALQLGLGDPRQPANLQNLAGATRLGLIWDMNVNGARGRARRSAGLSQGALFAAPAQELVRGRAARVPRDWRARWANAAAEVNNQGVAQTSTRMIALKTSPIWLAISRFGVPWAPFDFGSGMILRNIARPDAIALGLIEEDEILQADPDPNFNQGLEATMQGISPALSTALKSMLGNRISIQGDKATLTP
jgi:hypothetical protein